MGGDAASERSSARHRIVSRDGYCVIDYVTSQPAPTQWVAIGVVQRVGEEPLPPEVRLLVGAGQTEEAAVSSLRRRCMSRALHARNTAARR